MFDKLIELTTKFKTPITNYRIAKENREVLQQIKVEAQRLREEVNAIWKKIDAERKAAKAAK